MRFMDIELDGVTVRAQLNDTGAPKTAEALWNALPFEGTAVHAQLSGDMFRMLDHAPLPDTLEVESRQTYQHPGSVIYHPTIKEIAFCYGLARFKGHTGPPYLTPMAEIEGDITAFAEKARTLMRVGGKAIRFRRSGDQTTPFRYPARTGRKISIEFGGASLSATLLEDLAPKTTAALLRKLPLEGVATNDNWGGSVTRIWPSAYGTKLDLGLREGENERRLLWPGYAYYDTTDASLAIVYGDGYIGDELGGRPVTPVAALDAGLEAFRSVAASQLTQGEKPIRIRPA
ncbi:MAG TPA: DUF3830 family protein [Candidatus Limnocylindria bacterium]|nr:DUF3830 family protein [Candidatus Limnocylindria bacterium]